MCLKAHKRRATQKMAQIGPPVGKLKNGRFLCYSSSMCPWAHFRRRASKSSHFLASKADSGLDPRPLGLWELHQPAKPKTSRSRVWTDPTGYRYLIPWSNAALLRYLVRVLTSALPKSEYRRKAQIDDAARSVVRNIEEGYKRATTSEYLDFLGYSQGSLEEVKGDIRELTEDGFLASRRESSLAGIGIDLGGFNAALKGDKGSYRNLKDAKGNTASSYVPINVLSPPLKEVRAGDLTCEIFFELINKTDWNLRQLVSSLEQKLAGEQKFYKVEQARIREKFKKRK